jgi:hypothetical protein
MWPHLSREAKAKAAEQTKAQAEQKARNERLARHLDETIEAVRRDKQMKF